MPKARQRKDGEAMVLAASPKRWQPESGDGPSIPPTTPRHPTEPWHLEEIPAGEGGNPDAPPHTHKNPQWVRGWCAYVWILWQPRHGGPPLTDRAHLMQSPVHPVVPGSQAQVDRVVEEFRKANEMLFRDCGIAFQVCEVNVIDSSRLKSGPDGQQTSLADQFSADGKLLVQGGRSAFGEKLFDIVKFGNSRELREKMWKDCVHIFLTHDVEDPLKPNAVQGVGGILDRGAPNPISFAVVDAGSEILPQVIVHEIIHALGQEEHSTHEDSVFQEEIDAEDTMVDGALCEPLLEYLDKYIDPACP